MTAPSKLWCEGGRRSRTPQQTWEKLAPLLPVFGISRVANITGLDCIGIPVFTACRPNSRSLSVFQGKGITLDAARVSAVMEAYETWCAESIDLPLKLGSIFELEHTHSLIDIDGLPLTDVSGVDPLRPFLWIEGRDLNSNKTHWLPFEMVHANYALPEPPHSGVFAATTNGLASGNTRDEATLHALMEVIERDAITLWKLGEGAWGNSTALRLDSVKDPVCRSVLDQFEAAEIGVAVWDVTSDIGIPTFFCLIVDRHGEVGGAEFGGGAHPAPEIALSRALTEAAQARGTFIAGSREDIPDEDYVSKAVTERADLSRKIIAALDPAQDYENIASVETDSFQDDIIATMAALQRAGLSQAVMVDISKPAFGFSVVRVVVPGLEAAFEGPGSSYVPGLRASAILMKDTDE